MVKRRKQWVNLVCKQCKKSFEVQPSDAGRTFCSTRCKNAYGTGKLPAIECICPTCNQAFFVPNHEKDRRIYCSTKCANTRSEPNTVICKVCPGCNEEFTYTDYGQNKTFCSRKCWNESVRVREKECPACKTNFMPSETNKQKYCSPDCQRVGKRNRVTLTCACCGKDFWCTASLQKRKKYCSRECQLHHQFYSHEEKEVIKIISSIVGQESINQASFDWLLSSKKRRMHVDAYFPLLTLAVEYDGKQHRMFLPHYHKGENQFEELKKRDALKQNLLETHGIKLIRIRDDEPRTREYLRQRLQQAGITCIA